MAENLMTVRDVAAFLVVPIATVYAWNARGTGPQRMRVGKHVRYRRTDVEAWLDRQRSQDGAWS